MGHFFLERLAGHFMVGETVQVFKEEISLWTGISVRFAFIRCYNIVVATLLEACYNKSKRRKNEPDNRNFPP